MQRIFLFFLLLIKKKTSFNFVCIFFSSSLRFIRGMQLSFFWAIAPEHLVLLWYHSNVCSEVASRDIYTWDREEARCFLAQNSTITFILVQCLRKVLDAQTKIAKVKTAAVLTHSLSLSVPINPGVPILTCIRSLCVISACLFYKCIKSE